MPRRTTSVLIAGALAAVWAIRRSGRRFGIDREEARLPLPGDDLVAKP